MPTLSTRSPMTTARSSPTIRPSPRDSTPKVASPPLPFLGARTQREHQRAHPTIPAQGHRFPLPHTRAGPQHHGQAQQPAPQMPWLQDPQSAVLRDQPACCTYELNLFLGFIPRSLLRFSAPQAIVLPSFFQKRQRIPRCLRRGSLFPRNYGKRTCYFHSAQYERNPTQFRWGINKTGEREDHGRGPRVGIRSPRT